MFYYIIQFLIAFFATMGFSMYFTCPKRILIQACFVAGIVWDIYKYLFLNYNNVLMAGFIATFILGIISELCARKYRTPAISFILPGLIPMIPGAGTYYTMYYLIYGTDEIFKKTLNETFYVLVALALGVVASAGIVRAFVSIRNTRKQRF